MLWTAYRLYSPFGFRSRKRLRPSGNDPGRVGLRSIQCWRLKMTEREAAWADLMQAAHRLIAVDSEATSFANETAFAL